MTAQNEKKPSVPTIAKTSQADLKGSVERLELEMKEVLKNAIDQLAPGKPFNPSLIKELNKLEGRKNRLIAARLESLLRKGKPEARDIVDRILAIDV